MSYQRLAEHLKRTADVVVGNMAHLQGAKLATSAEKLEVALTRFDSAVRDALRGTDPAAMTLRDLLETDESRRVLDAKTLKVLAKMASGKALTLRASDTAGDHRRRFLEAMVKLGRVDEASSALKGLLAGASRPAPSPDDRDKVLAELWRLGTLGEADLEVERARLLANPALLRAMAGYAYLKVTAKSAPKTIFTNLVKFARRVQENTA